MFKNYLLLSLKVLKRKPFYTFVSLFGVSFTLLILMLLTSLSNAILGSNKPFSKVDDMILVPMIERTRTKTDTILQVDSVLVAGAYRYDSTYTYEDDITSTSNGPMSYLFATEELLPVENAVYRAIIASDGHLDGYLDGRKFSFSPYYVNADYYDVFDFEFLHGDRLYAEDIEQASQVVVITEKAAGDYFGEVSERIVGEEMDLGGKLFRVRGIVARPLSDNDMTGGDLYFPVTTIDNRALTSKKVGGGFTMAFLCADADQQAALQEEIDFLAENFQFPAEENHNGLAIMNSAPQDALAQQIMGEKDPKVARRRLFIPLIVLLALFVALPLLNLVNLNVGRVAERKAEIGVRKAFGATGSDILYQFIFENLVLTAIGGFIGLVLALGIISYVNANDLLGITRLSLQPRVFLYFLVAVLFFGFVSGILPAYRMSQTNVANSLR